MPCRYLAIVMAAWAFCGMPILCVSGVLEHHCAPADEHCPKPDGPDCPHEEPGGPHDDDDCKHESDCASDPCSNTIADRHREDDNSPLFSTSPLACVACIEERPVPRTIRQEAGEPAIVGIKFPSHPSDIPLLI